MDWLHTPAVTAGLGWLLLGASVLVVVTFGVALAVAAVCLDGDRADRAVAVLRELTRMVAALRKAPPPPT